uniref:Uncharacterized protein n=1 Tax=Cacopsylla melanoneura TaxID=428564 RepID=A0A8D8Z2D8_9HEMI
MLSIHFFVLDMLLIIVWTLWLTSLWDGSRHHTQTDQGPWSSETDPEAIVKTPRSSTQTTTRNTHPSKKLYVTGSNTSEMIALPVAIHGYLELHVPCHCEVLIENLIHIILI